MNVKYKTPFRMTCASAIGIFRGILPLIGIRIPLLIIFSFAFKLNIFALVAGLAITIVFPILHVLSFTIAQTLGGYQIPFFNLRYLSISNLFLWTEAGKYQFVGSIITGTILALISIPLFKWFYSWRQNNITQHNVNKFIFNDHTGQRWGAAKKYITDENRPRTDCRDQAIRKRFYHQKLVGGAFYRFLFSGFIGGGALEYSSPRKDRMQCSSRPADPAFFRDLS